MAVIIDGKKVSAQTRAAIAQENASLAAQGISVCLAVIIVGDDPASRVYVNNKKKACAEIGFKSEEYALPAETSQEQLLELIHTLNNRADVDGILCQLPLPSHIDETTVIESIAPEKDVDAFHPSNVGRIMTGNYHFLPCTPAGIMELIASENIDLDGKSCVVVGRSNIVGKPMSMLLLHKNATVTICHSHTEDLASFTRSADIVVAAVGIPNFIKPDMLKNGAVVIDVGINRLENGKLCGDVDFDGCLEKCSAITPVPGGVGPMTISMLMRNTLTAAKIKNKLI